MKANGARPSKVPDCGGGGDDLLQSRSCVFIEYRLEFRSPASFAVGRTLALPSSSTIQGAKSANRRMADGNTPFIFNEWYAAAFADELGRALFKRTLLGKRVVFYRTQDGRPVAMDDRCPHRSYPLSAGALDGDTIVCGYHGFRYDEWGNCIQVPSLVNCPKGIGVRTYPVLERGPIIWIWMGDPAIADPNQCIDLPWMTSDEWARAKGYFHLMSSYVYINENLSFDTSYLRPAYMPTTIRHARLPLMPPTLTIDRGRFALIRTGIAANSGTTAGLGQTNRP